MHSNVEDIVTLIERVERDDLAKNELHLLHSLQEAFWSLPEGQYKDLLQTLSLTISHYKTNVRQAYN